MGKMFDALQKIENDRFEEFEEAPVKTDPERTVLDSMLDQRRGRLSQDFRLRSADGHYLWFALKARPVVAGPRAGFRPFAAGTAR